MKKRIALLYLLTACTTFKKETPWPDAVGSYTPLPQHEQVSLPWSSPQPQSVKVKKYTNGNRTMVVQRASYSDEIEAIAGFLNIRQLATPHFNFSNENIRWGYISRQLMSAGLWHNRTVWHFSSDEKISRDDWSTFLNSFTAQFEKGNSRPAMFAIFLREETDLQQVIYDSESFFSAPWKTDRDKTGRFGFRIFADNLHSLNYLNSLTRRENYILEQHQHNRHSLDIVIAPGRIYFLHENYVIFISIENSTEAELRTEWLKIVNLLGY